MGNPDEDNTPDHPFISGDKAGNSNNVPKKTSHWLLNSKVCLVIVILLLVIIGLIVALIIVSTSHMPPPCEAETDLMNIVKQLCVNSSDRSSGCHLCPPSWLLHGDQCYYLSDVTDRTWDQSEEQCKMMGSDLLIIKDQDQQEFIQRTLSQRADDRYWIGLHPDEDGWRWVDGEQYNSSLFQIKTQPSGRCVSVTRSYYYQSSCSSAYRWMCIRKAVRI
ncbi:killer cell lectin-like receptor subfamily B member 1C [Dendropsophus ebraccatus]|uniref:killer cell lectin-like receptor subfamily B member 1C n=1 Tax=Dendropsophus ebraccatus TaxID=150705 RepID=UPI0038312F38